MTNDFRTLFCGCSFVFCFFYVQLNAQSAAALLRKADHLLAEGKTGEAAELYETAGRLKSGRSEALFQAAECYYGIRDYAKAVECYQDVKNIYERHESAGLHYARALKQSGQYETAMAAFQTFDTRYKGKLKAQYQTIASNEIKGCQLALELTAKHEESVADSLTINMLPAGVNTENNEFAPAPFSDRLLYYSVFQEGRAVFMRTQKIENEWQAPEEAQGLPASLAGRFGNGSFSADGTRFYCTQCAAKGNERKREDNTAIPHCEIYLLLRNDGVWSEPIRLRDPINLPGTTAMHPFAVNDQGREYLFFAAERPGGYGGLDLYVCKRGLDNGDIDFTKPENLGNRINTPGDEVTPFFDTRTRTLWFSSNGLVTLGGLDIFKSTHMETEWTSPENAGLPLNSPADDLFYIRRNKGQGGFFISNRLFENVKKETRDQDIFEFYP